jgi:hypothetical protein
VQNIENKLFNRKILKNIGLSAGYLISDDPKTIPFVFHAPQVKFSKIRKIRQCNAGNIPLAQSIGQSRKRL